jgi:hypothetical protein
MMVWMRIGGRTGMQQRRIRQRVALADVQQVSRATD